MDIAKVLAQLRSELANIGAAIESLERLQGATRRRGKPPALPAAEEPAGKPAARPPRSRQTLRTPPGTPPTQK